MEAVSESGWLPPLVLGGPTKTWSRYGELPELPAPPAGEVTVMVTEVVPAGATPEALVCCQVEERWVTEAVVVASRAPPVPRHWACTVAPGLPAPAKPQKLTVWGPAEAANPGQLAV